MNLSSILRAAEGERKRRVTRVPVSLRESYEAAWFLARTLRARVRGLRIMVGDDANGMHHWLENRTLYIDPTAPAAAMVGRIGDENYAYKNAVPSGFSPGEPRDHPRYVYAPETADSQFLNLE